MALSCRLPGAEIARRAPYEDVVVLTLPAAARAAPTTPAAAREEAFTWSEPQS